MPLKFKGSLDDLKDRVKERGVEGTWSEENGNKHVFRREEGGILNWWSSTKTVQCQGAKDERALLEELFSSAELSNNGSNPSKEIQSGANSQIFIVHGHDTDARDQLELALLRLQLEPFILMNQSGGGMTIIEALEGQIGKHHSSSFGIVLMTPDDMGYVKGDDPEKAEPRARQNVILETGMLLASLTRERMAIIVKGHIEIPSDMEGIIRYPYNDHIREIIPKLARRLSESGFDVSEYIAAATQ